MNRKTIPEQIRTVTCPSCGPQVVSWEWRCSGDTEVKCPECGSGLGVTVGPIRSKLQTYGWALFRRLLWRR